MESSSFWRKKVLKVYVIKIWNTLPYHGRNSENVKVCKAIINWDDLVSSIYEPVKCQCCRHVETSHLIQSIDLFLHEGNTGI